MPKMFYTAGAQNEKVLAAIAEHLADLLTQGIGAADTAERVQQQLAKMNEDENLIPGDRHYE